MPPPGAVITPLVISYAFADKTGIPGDVSRIPGAADAFMGRNEGALFAPGYPLSPVQQAELRLWDYQVGRNQIFGPRAYEPISFDQLIALADNHDITRLAIETRKDQIEKLDWIIRPLPTSKGKRGIEKRAQEATDFFLHPEADQDKPDNDFATWLRKLLHQVLVIDAPTLEVRRTREGEVIGFDVVNGATISVLIDNTGRRPKPPLPAFTQVIHGRPWKLLTEDEIIYRPRNPRPGKLYGQSPVEQIVNTINIALRRQTQQLNWYTDTNIPAGMINAPDNWTVDEIQQFQNSFDERLVTQAERSKLIWGPPGSKYQAFKAPPIKDEQDEWLARVVCYAFSLSPNALIHQMNRATAESAQEASLEEGLAPLKGWVKRLIDHLLARRGNRDLEFAWNDEAPVSPGEQQRILTGYFAAGIMQKNEVRSRIGLKDLPDAEQTPDNGETGDGPDAGNTDPAEETPPAEDEAA